MKSIKASNLKPGDIIIGSNEIHFEVEKIWITNHPIQPVNIKWVGWIEAHQYSMKDMFEFIPSKLKCFI